MKSNTEPYVPYHDEFDAFYEVIPAHIVNFITYEI